MKIVFQGKTKTGKEIVVRYPEMGDLIQMLNFINSVSDEKTFITYQGEHETLESEEKYLIKRLGEINEKRTVQLLAFCGNELVGSSYIQLMDKTEKHVGVFGLIVSKEFRGEGVGKILMELVEKEAKKNLPRLKLITLQVYSTNEIARSLYKKRDFVEYGMLPKGITRTGKFEDAVLMYKDII